MADEDTPDLPDVDQQRQERYLESRRIAEQMAAAQRVRAQSDAPPGSPTTYLGRGSQPLGTVQQDEYGIPLPSPRGAVGLRGHPSLDDYAAAAAQDRQTALGNAIDSDVSNFNGRYPMAQKFQMPSSDQLIDAGIQSKRNSLENEINTRKVHLGILPPSAIGAVATTLDSDQPIAMGRGHFAPSKASQTRRELSILEQSAGQLDRYQAQVVKQKTQMALQTAKDSQEYAQDQARGQVVDFLNNIDASRYPHGSDERNALVGKMFGQRPDWLHAMSSDPKLSNYVKDHMDGQDAVAKTMQALKTLYPDQQSLPSVGGVRMVPNVNAKGGVSFRSVTSQSPEQKEQTKLQNNLHARTGLTPDEFASLPESAFQAGGIFVGKPTSTDPSGGTFHEGEGGFNVNGTPKGEFNNHFTNVIEGYNAKAGGTITPEQEKQARDRIASGGAIQIDTGKGYKAVVKRSDFERYKDAFSAGGAATPTKSGNKVISVEDWLNQ